MRVLALTKYPRRGPSSRYRVLQFVPGLAVRGIGVDVEPLHDDRWLEARFAGRHPGRGYLLARLAHRVAALARARRYDVVLVQKEILPGVPDAAEALLARLGVPTILDVDDAIFLFYRGRRLLEGKIERVARRASRVLAGNAWLAAHLRTYNPRTEVFPTVVDTDRFRPPARPPARDVPVIGWIGSPETVGYLADIAPVLADLARRRRFRMRVVGARIAVEGVDVEALPWSEAGEADALRGMDVGVMPLPDTEWARGKCGLKLLQYMATGLATVSSPRGAAPEILGGADGRGVGLLADSPGAWHDALARLLDDAALRHEMGERARARVESAYGLRGAVGRLAQILRETGG